MVVVEEYGGKCNNRMNKVEYNTEHRKALDNNRHAGRWVNHTKCQQYRNNVTSHTLLNNITNINKYVQNRVHVVGTHNNKLYLENTHHITVGKKVEGKGGGGCAACVVNNDQWREST